MKTPFYKPTILLIIFSQLFLTSFAQKQHAEIPVNSDTHIFEYPNIITTLEHLAWSNPSYLSNDQYAAGILSNIINNQFLLRELFIGIDFERIRPFLTKYSNKEFVKNVEQLYNWSNVNSIKILSGNDFEDKEFNNIVEILEKDGENFSKYLIDWQKAAKFVVFPNGEHYTHGQDYSIQFNNPWLNVIEEYDSDSYRDKIKYIASHAAYGTSWIYKISDKYYFMHKRYDFDNNVYYIDSTNYNDGYNNVYYMDAKNRVYFKKEKDKFTAYHKNGKVSCSANVNGNDEADFESIEVAYDDKGKKSYENGNGVIFWHSHDYGFPSYGQYLTLKNKKILKKSIQSKDNVLVEELLYDGDIENTKKYNFKNGKIIYSRINDIEKIFKENMPNRSEYNITVELHLLHGILPYGSVYPVGSKSYVKPEIINEEEVKQTILKNIDSFIDFKSVDLNYENQINCRIPYDGYKFISSLDKPSSILNNVAKIKKGKYKGVELNSEHDLYVTVILK